MSSEPQKHLETSGPFAGLWVRTVKALTKAGYANKEEVRADIESGALHPHLSVRYYGKHADREVRLWLGMRTWKEQWGKVPTTEPLIRPASVRGKGLFGN